MSAAPDIFLSYNREDQAVARRFAEAFERAGLNVWWDVTLRSGEAYDEVTENALNQARAVVVLWSPRSVTSRWVRSEATQADRNKRLVPVMIEPCRRPIMFELTQTADLAHWDGSPTDRVWLAFLADVQQFVRAGTGAASGMPSAPAPAARASMQHTPLRPDRLSICVLPFANMSADPEQEFFSDGITEDIITDLSKASALSVIARNTAFTFKGKSIAVPQIARQLNVTHVLEGSVRRAGQRVRITAQLIDGAAGDHVWAERWDRNLDDIFALQDEISEAIVKALKLRLLPGEKQAIEDRGTTNVEAYEIFLRARALHNTISGPEVRRSLELYRQAVALDPNFVQAWAGLSQALYLAMIYFPDLRTTAPAELEGALASATALAPDRPEVRAGHLARCLARRDWAGAEEHLAVLGSATLKGFQGPFRIVACALGRANEAVEGTLIARAADPLSLGLSFNLQIFLDCAGRLDDAEAEYERSKDLPGSRGNAEWRAVIRAMSRQDATLVRQRFAAAFGQDTSFMPFAPRLLQVIDRRDEALAILRAAFDDPACQDGGRLGAIAHWATYYGDDDLALRALHRGYVDLAGLTVVEIWGSAFARLRRDPRFKDIVRDLGLAKHWRRTGNWGDFARPAGDHDFEVYR
jgi:TolB-like protein